MTTLAKRMAGLACGAALGGTLMAAPPPIPHHPFGRLPDGRVAQLYTLSNPSGMRVAITNYGGIVQSIQVPDRAGKLGDVVLGYDTLAGYLADTSTYFGALIGRYANRIAFGHFSLDGHTYTLAVNNGKNSLHGGIMGFNRQLWKARDVSTAAGPALELTYVSRDGEEGYPGTLSVRVVYSLAADDALHIAYSASTDQDTVLNLTNHTYFNLSGEGSGSILNTVMTVYARQFTPIDSGLIPTGAIAPVAATPLDFTRPTPIGARIHDPNQQLAYAGGYDFNYVLDSGGGQLALAAEAYDPASGRRLRVSTTEPGIQLYTGNFLTAAIHGKAGHTYPKHAGFTLEAQHFPDSPNHPNFPSTELKPGQTYHQTTVFQFSAH
ncbi:MAG TPA: aldose epimerase family protein [Terriglobales bacterium]|nr:aldose epimerase family protein [Terriglobales bacterium]